MSRPYFSIKGRAIRDGLDPYIIAEIGVNHGGDMALAQRLVREARQGGAHAVKFQSYKAATIASRHSPAYWDTTQRSEERRVGKACGSTCRTRWPTAH